MLYAPFTRIKGVGLEAKGNRVVTFVAEITTPSEGFVFAMANAGVAPEVRMKLTGHSDKDVQAS